MIGRTSLRAFALVAILPGVLLAQGRPAADPPAVPPAEPSVTHHTARIGGQAVSYTATAGTLPIVEDGDTMAFMFYVAYIRDGIEDKSDRPIFFSFNGGPGTASLWMHMGYTGPRRVVYDEEGFPLRPPARIEDNPYSILDVADIVYIDPIATGFSRMAPGKDEHKYHGVMEDIASVGEFIRLYTTQHDRWGSPKFVIGESYGTTRASGLAGYLQSEYQMYLNGVILVSMTELGVDRGDDVSYATALPHMTATAWYHHQLPADLQARPLEEVLAESEAFALGDYLLALAKGHDLPETEKAEVIRQLARLTGLSPEYIESANLRVSVGRFRKELLRDQRLTVGRLDSRYTGVDQDAAGESYDHDPAMVSWNGPFGAAVNQYLREELGYDTDLQYNVWGDVRPWNREARTTVGEMLRSAMTENPYLKVLIQGGYYDGATTYFDAKYTIAHLQPGGELRDRFRFAFYPSGHMMYLRKEDLARAKQDLVAFVRWALEATPQARPVTTAAAGAQP
ncbi:MAG TPA: hypothetical protein VF188_07365 [Longimicrobiales bacterium]